MSGIVVLIVRVLVMATLYAFLGWAIYTLWKDLHTQGGLISAPEIPTLVLIPVGDEAAQAYPRGKFQLPEVVLGRSAANEYPLADDTVSGRHARFSYHHKQWWIEDLHSTNGTFLNDERLNVPTVVVSGDELRIGDLNLLLSIGEKEGESSNDSTTTI